MGLAGLMILQFALYRILDRFEADPLQDARVVFSRRTYDAALAFMPFGSGLGTFVSIYAGRERVQDALPNTYANHAHNDYLELWLETGVPGLLLLAAVLTWLVWRSLQAWRRPATGAEAIDHWLARAASVAVVLLLLHSALDYPLRTGAAMVVFAFACALLVDPLRPAPLPALAQVRAPEADKRRQRPKAQPNLGPPEELDWPAQAGTEASPAPKAAAKPGAQWTTEAAWPEAWSKPTPQGADKRNRPRQPKPGLPDDAE
jgi:O-Antigen ligase